MNLVNKCTIQNNYFLCSGLYLLLYVLFLVPVTDHRGRQAWSTDSQNHSKQPERSHFDFRTKLGQTQI